MVEYLKKAWCKVKFAGVSFLAGFLTALIAVFTMRKKEKEATPEPIRLTDGDEEFKEKADEERKSCRDTIALVDRHDVADMYPDIWDAVVRGKDSYGKAVDRIRNEHGLGKALDQ